MSEADKSASAVLTAADLRGTIVSNVDVQRMQELNWTGTFDEYLAILVENPLVARNAFQRVYDMLLHFGSESYKENRDDLVRYKFFSDPMGSGKDAIYGLERPLMKLVDFLRSAALGYGTARRVLLLHGPVGSSKSTIARLLKKGLEYYSALSEGALYSFGWRLTDDDDDGTEHIHWCPMHEEPLKLVPPQAREKMVAKLNDQLSDASRICVEGHLDPFCRRTLDDLLKKYDYDFDKVLEHVVIRRVVLSEKDRIGIGTFQPKDEKNQDSTELTGDINYRKIAEYGSDSDPRAFNFDGELNIANRGLVEFIEVLKLDVAFLYDLLGASQEHSIKPKKFAQTDIDEVIIGHTNEPEYKKLQSNEMMEAFRDRTIKIDVPYCVCLQDEIRVYEKDFGKVRNIHIAPHTIEIAAMWAILTRLEEPKKSGLSLIQKLRLYDGKSVPGYTEDSVKELRADHPREGMQGISPRYIQDKISNALASEQATKEKGINPFMVMNELESGLDHHSLISDPELKKRYMQLLGVARVEYDDILKHEVQRAISADEEAVKTLCGNYIENVRAYTQHEKVRNKYTGKDEEPDERLMRSIEEKIEIPESRKEDFRQEIMNYIGSLALDDKKFEYSTNARLQKALELKLFEDQRDTIKLKSVVSGVVDEETQAKIDIIKERLKSFGYTDESATDVLNYVASIFARGDAKDTDD